MAADAMQASVRLPARSWVAVYLALNSSVCMSVVMAEPRLRCAIYTRKSTEDGLDKPFNSLDAQHEACAAYIDSQKHEGWERIDRRYDDGGYSGATMKRPALEALLAGVRAGVVSVIVVYKVDRLSRSLSDFAKIVEILDENHVSFVSITQQFNTTSSMGRLTLNMLLSFAQFEREVISERVRDKVAASKQKGMWMGGVPPLGYDIEQRRLVVNAQEAGLVGKIFDQYLALHSCITLAIRLNEMGHRNKAWANRHGAIRGGQAFTNQALSKILNNPIYIGQTRHKEKTYKGQHDAIIPMDIWHQVQAQLNIGREKRVPHQTKYPSLLAGKIYDCAGALYTPTYTVKNKTTHYRYYLLKSTGHRINAAEMEAIVADTLRVLSTNLEHWHACWCSGSGRLMTEEAQHCWQKIWRGWSKLNQKTQSDIAQKSIDRILMTEGSISIRMCYAGMIEAVSDFEGVEDDDVQAIPDPNFKPDVIVRDDYLDISLPIVLLTNGCHPRAANMVSKQLHVFEKAHSNATLVRALVKSYRWNQMLQQGKTTITQLAQETKLGRTYVSRMVGLSLLAPDIITAIMNGTQPRTLRLKDIMTPLPMDWGQQRVVLGHI
jgi:site-specific DNA recombinase